MVKFVFSARLKFRWVRRWGLRRWGPGVQVWRPAWWGRVLTLWWRPSGRRWELSVRRNRTQEHNTVCPWMLRSDQVKLPKNPLTEKNGKTLGRAAKDGSLLPKGQELNRGLETHLVHVLCCTSNVKHEERCGRAQNKTWFKETCC